MLQLETASRQLAMVRFTSVLMAKLKKNKKHIIDSNQKDCGRKTIRLQFSLSALSAFTLPIPLQKSHTILTPDMIQSYEYNPEDTL